MRRLIAIAGAAVVLLVLVLAQLLLPGIAADQLRDRLSKNGKVESVSVSAFPAIELLWHDADKVVVRMASYRSRTGKLSSLLDEAGGVGTLDASRDGAHRWPADSPQRDALQARQRAHRVGERGGSRSSKRRCHSCSR